jgi:hypothetical protein
MTGLSLLLGLGRSGPNPDVRPAEPVTFDWAPVRAAHERLRAMHPNALVDVTVVILSDTGGPPDGLSYQTSMRVDGHRCYGSGPTPERAVETLLHAVEEQAAVERVRAGRAAAAGTGHGGERHLASA